MDSTADLELGDLGSIPCEITTFFLFLSQLSNLVESGTLWREVANIFIFETEFFS